MKVGILQATSQIDKNMILFDAAKKAVPDSSYDVINFGCFPDETDTYSYIEIALEVSLLLSSGAVDFMITGCSSGQGMMLACNSCPGVLCGYVANPQDAFLFGRINDGNAVSFPLGLNYGWAGEINLECTLERLFDGPFGCGYPLKDADRKKKDTKILKNINSITKKNAVEVYDNLQQKEPDVFNKALQRESVISYILDHGTNKEVKEFISSCYNNFKH